jgi:hypothetical protein
MVLNTSLPRLWITLVPIDHHLSNSALIENIGEKNLVR